MSKHGRFIAIEGPDGSGKATHSKLLIDWLRTAGHDVEPFSFPQYGTPSAYFAEQYLAGNFGALKDISAYRGSLFYALDRYDASFQIRSKLSHGDTIVSDRYVIANMGDQGSKLRTKDERLDYYKWLDDLEFGILGIPRPDLNILLIMPPEIADKLVGGREGLSYLGNKNRDLHEADIDHMRRVQQNYVEISQLFPNLVTRIDCVEDGEILPVETIQAKVRTVVSKHLAK